METSKELLHVDPERAYSSFIIKKDGKLKVTKEQQQPRITKLESPSALLRAKEFLPLIASANESLEKEIKAKSTSEFDIEDVDEKEDYIEMNIGIFPRNDDENETSSSTESDSDTDMSKEESICTMFGEVTENNFKIRKEEKRKDTIITEIRNEEQTNNKITKTKQKRQHLKNVRKNRRKRGK